MVKENGECKTHGVVIPVYEGFLGTVHCSICGDFVSPTDAEVPYENTQEALLKQRLADIHRDTLERAKPLIAELARLEAMKPPREATMVSRTLSQGVTLLLEDLEPVLDMALRWHQRHVGGQSCTTEHSRAIRTVTQEFEAAGGSLEPREHRA